MKITAEELMSLRQEQEIRYQIDLYKEQLALAMREKNNPFAAAGPELDLTILSLIDRLEILLWTLGSPLPPDDLLDKLPRRHN